MRFLKRLDTDLEIFDMALDLWILALIWHCCFKKTGFQTILHVALNSWGPYGERLFYRLYKALLLYVFIPTDSFIAMGWIQYCSERTLS